MASNNQGKLREIKQILGDGFFELVTLNDIGLEIKIEETENTFFGNAFLKAKGVFDACGLPCLADDSGLCVEALNGDPGVQSAYFAGYPTDNEKNNALLLEKMKGVTNRNAKFVSAVVLHFGENNYGESHIAGSGETTGKILDKLTGEGGFGYDPLFYSDELKCSFGEADPEEKNKISHRGRALKDLMTKMRRALFART